jgi:hypothetical protein
VFQEEFLKLVGPDLPAIEGPFEVDTQHAFRVKGSRRGEAHRGLFDLVLYSPDLFLAIESKIDAGFGPGQLKKYRDELDQSALEYGRNRRLITLTKWLETPPEAHIHRKWSQVQKILSEIKVENENLQSIYSQFADFLQEKGMRPMEIPKVNPQLLASYWNGMQFEKTLQDILEGLREHGEIDFQLRRRAKFEFDPDGTVWLGIYISDDVWAGFGFGSPEKKEWEFSMRVCKSFKGNLQETAVMLPPGLEQHLQRPLAKLDGWTFFNFDQAINSGFDGNVDAIKKWMADTISKVQKIRVVRGLPYSKQRLD